MHDFLSLRYLESLKGTNGGFPVLDDNGKIPDRCLPAATATDFVGNYDDLSALTTAYDTGSANQYAYVVGKKYYWNTAKNAWTAVEITFEAYNLLSDAEKAGQPQWLIIPTAV